MTAKSWRRVAKWAARTALLLTLGCVLFAISVLIIIPRATHGTALTVLTGSMTPDIPVGSVVVDRPVDPGTLHVGDIATYQKTPGKAEYITHRIVKIDTSKTPTQFTFKGDANKGADIAPVPATAIRGKVWFHVPFLGSIRDAVQTKGGLIGVAMVLLAGYALLQVAGAYKDRRSKQARSAPELDAQDSETPTLTGAEAMGLMQVRQRLKLLTDVETAEADHLTAQALLRVLGGVFLDDDAAFAQRVADLALDTRGDRLPGDVASPEEPGGDAPTGIAPVASECDQASRTVTFQLPEHENPSAVDHLLKTSDPLIPIPFDVHAWTGTGVPTDAPIRARHACHPPQYSVPGEVATPDARPARASLTYQPPLYAIPVRTEDPYPLSHAPTNEVGRSLTPPPGSLRALATESELPEDADHRDDVRPALWGNIFRSRSGAPQQERTGV